MTISTAPSRFRNEKFSDFLATHKAIETCYSAALGFLLYSAMNALRKPFSVSKFEDEFGDPLEWFGTGTTLKTALVMCQTLGYMTSKFIAVKVTSEAKGKQDYWLVGLYFAATLSLLLFGIVGSHYPDMAPFIMFLNGLPLGLFWGMVVMYFEGRSGSDFILVCFSISFIVSSGIVKDVGLTVLSNWGVSQFWMPAVVGLIFGPMFLGCILGLNQLTAPSIKEAIHKGERTAMSSNDKWDYFTAYWPGLLALWVAACFLTAYRDFRDSFYVEILEDTGVDVVPGTLTATEGVVAGVVLIPIAGLVFCENNLLAFQISMFFLISGAVIMLVSTYAYLTSSYDGVHYYILSGVASYLSYVPYNSLLYERLIAVLRTPCTVSYLMAVMDASGYVGVVAVYLVAEYGDFDNHLDVFNSVGQMSGWIMLALWIFTSLYFFYSSGKLGQTTKESSEEMTDKCDDDEFYGSEREEITDIIEC